MVVEKRKGKPSLAVGLQIKFVQIMLFIIHHVPSVVHRVQYRPSSKVVGLGVQIQMQTFERCRLKFARQVSLLFSTRSTMMDFAMTIETVRLL